MPPDVLPSPNHERPLQVNVGVAGRIGASRCRVETGRVATGAPGRLGSFPTALIQFAWTVDDTCIPCSRGWGRLLVQGPIMATDNTNPAAFLLHHARATLRGL